MWQSCRLKIQMNRRQESRILMNLFPRQNPIRKQWKNRDRLPHFQVFSRRLHWSQTLTAWIRIRIMCFLWHYIVPKVWSFREYFSQEWKMGCFRLICPLYQMTDLIWKKREGSVMWVSQELWRSWRWQVPDSGCSGEKYSIIKYPDLYVKFRGSLWIWDRKLRKRRKRLKRWFRQTETLQKWKWLLRRKHSSPENLRWRRLLHWITKWEILSATLNLV